MKQFRKFDFVVDLSERVGMVIPVTRPSVTFMHWFSIGSEGQKELEYMYRSCGYMLSDISDSPGLFRRG